MRIAMKSENSGNVPMSSSHGERRSLGGVLRSLPVRVYVASIPDWAFLVLVSTCLSLIWLLLFQPALSYYWNFDDFHLIRVFTPWELLQSWRGNWDPDFLETSHRPI